MFFFSIYDISLPKANQIAVKLTALSKNLSSFRTHISPLC